MKASDDIGTLKELAQLQNSRIQTFLREQLQGIDGQLRHATGDSYRVLQGKAQTLETLIDMIDGAGEQIKRVQMKQGIRIPMSKAF